MTKKPAAVEIDEIRRSYRLHAIDLESALLHIQALVSGTRRGALDLLQHPQSAQERYANVFRTRR